MSIDAKQILQDGARTGKMDNSNWPEVLEYVLPHLDNIVYNEFPAPRMPVSIAAQAPASPALARNGDDGGATSSTPTRSPKTVVVPATPQNTGLASGLMATPEHQPTSPSIVPDSQPPPASSSNEAGLSSSGPGPNATSTVAPPEGTLPPPILTLYSGIVAKFKGPFAKLPPYTLQRLSELLLEPNRQYKTLPAYLRALDKVLSVASTADVYPLAVPPEAVVDRGETGGSYLSQTNGLGGGLRSGGKDDAFNGAELTRIPWVRDSAEGDGDGDGDIDAPGEPVDGVVGIGSPPERILLEDAQLQRGRERRRSPNTAIGGTSATPTTGATGSVTAGVPADTVALQSTSDGDVAVPTRQDEQKNDDLATARGPQEIGNEDIGPQHTDGQGYSMPGIVDLEAAVGRPGEGEVVPGSNVQVPEERRAASEEKDEAKTADVEMGGAEGEESKDQKG